MVIHCTFVRLVYLQLKPEFLTIGVLTIISRQNIRFISSNIPHQFILIIAFNRISDPSKNIFPENIW